MTQAQLNIEVHYQSKFPQTGMFIVKQSSLHFLCNLGLES